MLEIAQIYHVLNLELKKKTVRSLEYYGEGSRKLSILHARLRHQCSSLNSDLYGINNKGCQRHYESTSWCCIVFIVSAIMITDTRYCRR
jgi:hypothetical protein